ncbi:CPBP family intramembrane glutamic endopeptidase [Catenulispora acidiphila]|nr:CPBP family intramembrane glutamic endopeptidase [Catenulispora acidiphila]
MSVPTPAAPPPIRATYAYPAILAVYAAVFGAAAFTWTALLLYTYHALPEAWMAAILRHQNGADVVPAVLAGLAALMICAALITSERGKQIVVFNSPGRRVTALGIIAAALIPVEWALRHVQLLESDDLTPRIVELVGSAALAGALAVVLAAPEPAELGIGGRKHRSITEFYALARTSLLGLLGSLAAVNLILYGLKPPALVGPVGPGSGMVESFWFWIAVACVNAVVEEGICTAWLYALLHRAGRPRYEIYAVAVLARVGIHLYMGLPGLGAAIFALVNIRLFERTGRVAPLILAHACFDCATITGNRTVLYVFISAGALMLLYPPSFLPRRRATEQNRGDRPQHQPAMEAARTGGPS